MRGERGVGGGMGGGKREREREREVGFVEYIVFLYYYPSIYFLGHILSIPSCFILFPFL